MRLATQPFRRASSMQVSLADSVDAAREVLQPVVAEVVAARHQEVELGVMAGAEERTGLSHHPAVKVDDVRPDLQRRGRFRNQVHEGRRVLPRVERDRPQVLAGDQRVVDQVVERDRLECGVAFAGRLLVLSVAWRLGLECGREPPAARQPQAEPHHDVVARRAVGIEQARAPVDHPHRVVAVAQVAGCLDRRPVTDDVEPRDDLVHAVGYVALDLDRLRYRRGARARACRRASRGAAPPRPGSARSGA